MTLVKTEPDLKRTQATLKLVKSNIELVESFDHTKFRTQIIKEKYEIIRELFQAIMYERGYKTIGEKAHKQIIDFIYEREDILSEKQYWKLNTFRQVRNDIVYKGIFVTDEYFEKNIAELNKIVKKSLKYILKHFDISV